MNFLIDHHLERYGVILLGKIANEGWLDLIPIRFITFKEIELPTDSNDRTVWRIAQENQMILLTANRNMQGEDSLEQVLREDNTPDSLPVVTMAICNNWFSRGTALPYPMIDSDNLSIKLALDQKLKLPSDRVFYLPSPKPVKPSDRARESHPRFNPP
jgi:hypothetical protein